MPAAQTGIDEKSMQLPQTRSDRLRRSSLSQFDGSRELARARAPALLERAFFYSGATDGGNNSCAIITPTLAYLPDQIGGDNKARTRARARLPQRDRYLLAVFK